MADADEPQAAIAPITHANAGGSMRPQFLSTAGEPEIKWHMWFRMFQDHLVAHGLDTVAEARRLTILRSSLGAQGYRICIDLCPEADLSFDQTVQRLANRFAPQQSRILARSNFNRKIQQQGENSQQVVTALRALAAKCNYRDDFLNEVLLDRFVAGCTNEKIRERLLLEPDTLTLDQAITLATNIERATAETKALQVSSSGRDTPVQKVNRRQTSPHGKRNRSPENTFNCFYCGKPRQGASHECSARNHPWITCMKTGHFEAVCWKNHPKLRPISRSRRRFSPG